MKNLLNSMKKLLLKINNLKYLSFILVMSLIITRLPPFYIIPYKYRFFTSHSIVKVFHFILLFFLLKNNGKELSEIYSKNKIYLNLIVVYFLIQSISVITALDINAYLNSFQTVVITYTIFINSILLLSKTKYPLIKISFFIRKFAILIIFLEIIFFIFNKHLLPLSFLQNEYLDAIMYNIDRQRYTLELNPETLLPFVFISTSKYTNVILVTLVAFTSFLSNFRSRLILLFFSLILMVRLYSKEINQKLIITLTIILVPLLVLVSNEIFSSNVLRRFSEIITSKRQDYRILSINKTFDIIKKSPLLGVGLGNYDSIYRDNKSNNSLLLPKYAKNYTNLVSKSPHNIFLSSLSETGVIGFISLSILIIYFLKFDIYLIKQKNKQLIPYIISAWSTFIFTLFNPSHTIFVIGWFWFMRAIVLIYNK